MEEESRKDELPDNWNHLNLNPYIKNCGFTF